MVRFTALMTVIFLSLPFYPVRAEQPPMDPVLMRMMQAKQEEDMRKAQEAEFQTPLKAEIPKGAAILGNRNAPILIVEYSDFQCPFCKQGFQNLKEVEKKYGKKVAVLFKNLPLPMHPMAMPAAQRFAAIALQSPKKAYAYHDEVFANQERLSSDGEKFLDEAAKKAGANVDKMKKDMETAKVKDRIAADMEEAKKFGFTGTPGFIVAGVSVRGAYPPPVFESIIDRRLAEKGKKK